MVEQMFDHHDALLVGCMYVVLDTMRQVYNPQTMEDEILMVSGMPLRIGKQHHINEQA